LVEACVGSELQRDLDALNRAIAQIYDAVLQAELWPRALDELAVLCDGAGIGVFPIEQRIASLPEFLHSTADIADACTSLAERWSARFPFTDDEARQPAIHWWIRDGNLVTAERICREPFYQEFSRAFVPNRAMIRGTSILPASGHYALVSPFLLENGPPSDSQRATFELLSIHALKALTIYLGIGAANRVDALMDLQQCGIITIGASGTISAANDMARKLSGDGFSIANGRLSARQPSAQKALDRMLACAFNPDASDDQTSPVALGRSRGRRPLIVTAFPSDRRSDRRPSAFLRAADTVTVIITDPELSGSRNTGEAIFAALGLTRAEARIAAIIGSGTSPEAAAETLEVSVGTIRNHLKIIYLKLGISRQGELVAMAGKMTVLGNF
jgi:DNA-binding CsgD family transcriptional regulator